jgi:transposase
MRELCLLVKNTNKGEKIKPNGKKKLQKRKRCFDQPSNTEKKARRYFLKNTGEKKYQLDQQKIDQQASFDGFKAIATNAKDITPQMALEKYKDLYKIEQSFSSFKSYFETRPMFHWTNTRIEGHLVLALYRFAACVPAKQMQLQRADNTKITKQNGAFQNSTEHRSVMAKISHKRTGRIFIKNYSFKTIAYCNK